uniref:basic proline-rich protein-like n=1 Tax=Panthera onca TaxID=9690 RepID=UPI002953B7EB|nr:basic proline-rich protein-like [Panthera onca]XP_060505576.1 basic proline-rich protein-like [Panthera onca]
MCAINHLVANKNSACLPCICQWRLHFPSMCLSLRGDPSLHFIRVEVRGRRAPPPPPPAPSSWAFVGPSPLAPPSRHTLTPAAARVASGARPGAGPGDTEAAAPGSWPRGAQDGLPAPALRARRSWGRSGPRRGAARPGRSVRALVFAAPSPPPAGPRAPAPPQSLGKQRPGAILGRGVGGVGTDPRPGGGRSRAPPQTPAASRRPPLGNPLPSFGVCGSTLSAPADHTEMSKPGRAPCAGRVGGARSAVRPGLAAIFRLPLLPPPPPPPPHTCVYPAGSLAKKCVDAVRVCVCVCVFCTDWAENRLEGGTSCNLNLSSRRACPGPRSCPRPAWAAGAEAFCVF